VYITSAGLPVYGSNDLLDAGSWRRVGNSFPGLGHTLVLLRACAT
jgi:hypothetical protein